MARKKASRSAGAPVRDVTAGSHNRSFSGHIPVAKGGGLTAFESFLEENLIRLMGRDAGITMFRPQPETFAWRGDVDKRCRRYTPDFLVRRADGTRVYREVKPFKILSANPTLSGRRTRIEFECSARGAEFEIWTEHEIRGIAGAERIIRPANGEERMAFHNLDLGAKDQGGGSIEHGNDPMLRAAADLLKIPCLYPHRLGWLGKSDLTNVVMSIFGNLRLDPDTKQISWT